ncbi:hypothetical protein F4604DRAFT_876837 [Suillus subluteus]|nr:hypothetical protein F4604DRAFT_876837 [Suillus subluteus]
MITGHFTRILNILKKWLSRLARRSASLFFVVLSLLRRFVAGHLKFGDRRLITRSSSGVLPRSQEDIGGEGSPICPSLLPPGQMGREATEEPPSPSDEPYTGSHPRNPRPLRKGTAIPPLDANPTTIGYTSATQTDGLHQGSVSSLHLSLHMEESSVKSKTFHKDGALQEFSSPGPSHLSGLHEVSTTHSRPRGYMDDAHSVNTTRTRSMRHLTPGMPYSQYASDSRVSVGSLARSIAGSEVRQAAYRTHTGPVYSRPISVSSVVDVHHVHHGSPNAGSIPLDSSAQAVPLSDHGFDHHVHYTAPPGSNELPGQEVVMVYDGPQTCPMVTDNVRRYERCHFRNLDVTNNTVRAMTMGPHEMNVPQGWTAFVHPEGARYFVNQETRTFTEMNVCEPDICDDIEYFMQYLLDELEQAIGEGGLSLMKEVDLVVEPKCFDGESVVCCYYFANHRDRCLFWLDDFNPEHIISECKGIRSSSHLWFAIEAQYWRHWDYFPSLCPVTESIVNELKDMLIHATCDHLTSLGSSAAFDAIEIKDHLSVVDKIKIRPTPPTPTTPQSMRRGHAAIVIGRIMYTLTHNHFVNYHGEDCARLNFEQSVHGWTYKPSPLMVILAPLLFFDPVAQVQELHKIFVDEVAHTARWNAFCSNFKGQLQDSNLLATVLLNANVGFLAINTVDRGGRDAIQLASYMSLVTSLGSIVLGLFFVSHSRTSGQNTAMEAAVFLGKLHNRNHGLERLAIIYSLPKALLMWGMAFFFAAFSTDWWTSGDITSRTIVGTVTLVILMMISNSIILTREGAKWSWRPTWRPCGDVVQGLSSRLADAWKQLMQLGQTDPTDNPRTHTDAIDLGTFVDFSAEADAQMRGTSRITTLPSSEIPGSDNHGNHPNSPSPPVRPPHPTASVDAPQQPHAGNFVLPSSDSRTNLGVLSGASSLQQIRENTQMVFQDQSTTEARCEPG